MIGYLRGQLLSIDEESVVLDVAGVGYEVLCSSISLSALFERVGTEVGLWVHTHVREDALQLFGFREKSEKTLFLSLLKVNGIGPKSALNVLSGAEVGTILDWIEDGDAKALSKLPKIGKKTAEQMILTLQGKLVRAEAPKAAQSDHQKQIFTALVNLGFKTQKVEEFITGLPREIAVEEGVRRGLTILSNA